MHKKIISFNLEKRNQAVSLPKPGEVVKVHRKITEKGKEINQIFEGMVIAVKGKQSSSPTITVRKVSDGIGVELVVPLYSPLVEKIEIIKSAKTRRAKLYYLRNRSAKSLKLKYRDVSAK